MKSVSVFVCLFITFLLLKKTECNFDDFLSNLPREIGDALSGAWSVIIDAIKKPIRIKRLGYGGKRKSTTTSSLTTFITTSTTTEEPPKTISSFSLYPSIRGLQVPIFRTPYWRTMDEWKNLQRYIKIKGNGEGSSTTPPVEVPYNIQVVPSVTVQSNLDDEEKFGVLFFI